MVCNLKIRVQLCLLEINYRGPQFRKAFHNLGGLRSLSSAPVMALTASAPAAIEAHVVSFLSMRTPVYVRNPLDRGNIYYSVMKKSSISVSDPTLLPFRTLCIDPSPPSLSLSPPPPVHLSTSPPTPRPGLFLSVYVLYNNNANMYSEICLDLSPNYKHVHLLEIFRRQLYFVEERTWWQCYTSIFALVPRYPTLCPCFMLV